MNIEDEIKQVQNIYLQHGFKTTFIHADSKLKHLRVEMADLGIYLNCASNEKHVPKIDQFSHTVKERIQSEKSAMPFK